MNIGPTTEKEIPKVQNISPTKFLKERNKFNFLIAHISNEEVLDIVNSLSNKATGPYSVPLKLLILISDLIIIPLCNIINMSLFSGIYPDKLKIVKVIPTHKGGSTQDLNNFRFISLLCIFDKIIEKIIHARLYEFLELHNILYVNQFGFRKNNSTIFALMQITEKIKESIDSGKFGCGIFIDLRKAFDTVNHDILLHKLDHYGIRGSILNWFKSYLTNRKQYVDINGESSKIKEISCGVSQSSVLGPLLFLLYINDLPNISLFADDTNIYYESNSLQDLEKKINKELGKLQLWLNVNRLSLNISKTNYIIFHPFNKPLNQNITLKIRKKSQQNYIKYLGVIIAYNISCKISRAIGVMYKLSPFLKSTMLRNVYYSLIYSHIVYGIQVWGSAGKTEIDKILVLQKRAIRLISNKAKRPVTPGPLASTNPMFLKLEILKVNDIFTLHLSKFIYKCLIQETPVNFHDWFKLYCDSHSYNTRSNISDINNITKSNNLFIRSARTSFYGLRLIKVEGPKLWNALPKSIRSITSIQPFITNLKNYMVKKYI